MCYYLQVILMFIPEITGEIFALFCPHHSISLQQLSQAVLLLHAWIWGFGYVFLQPVHAVTAILP